MTTGWVDHRRNSIMMDIIIVDFWKCPHCYLFLFSIFPFFSFLFLFFNLFVYYFSYCPILVQLVLCFASNFSQVFLVLPMSLFTKLYLPKDLYWTIIFPLPMVCLLPLFSPSIPDLCVTLNYYHEHNLNYRVAMVKSRNDHIQSF